MLVGDAIIRSFVEGRSVEPLLLHGMGAAAVNKAEQSLCLNVEGKMGLAAELWGWWGEDKSVKP